jgi:hypothetical protein
MQEIMWDGPTVVWDPVIIIFDFFLVSKPNWAISKYSRVIFVVFSSNFFAFFVLNTEFLDTPPPPHALQIWNA